VPGRSPGSPLVHLISSVRAQLSFMYLHRDGDQEAERAILTGNVQFLRAQCGNRLAQCVDTAQCCLHTVATGRSHTPNRLGSLRQKRRPWEAEEGPCDERSKYSDQRRRQAECAGSESGQYASRTCGLIDDGKHPPGGGPKTRLAPGGRNARRLGERLPDPRKERLGDVSLYPVTRTGLTPAGDDEFPIKS
jgi:hypothetical protein